MGTCLFCGKRLDNSSEHILQECLGAKWESKSILCKECNKLFGDTIDHILGEVFIFFRNYLRIPGKREKIPRLGGLFNEAGEEFIKTPDTGELVKQNQKYVHVENHEDGSIALHIKGDLTNVVRIAEEQRKNFEKKGYHLSVSKFSSYRTEPVGNLRKELSLSLPVYLAVLKSLLNYCGMVLSEEERARIVPLAHKVRDFAEFCEDNEDDHARASMAREWGLRTYPLIVTATEQAQTAIKGDRNLFHALFLTPKADGLYGGVCLFNEIWWGFKLSDEPGFPSGAHIVIFDIGAEDKPGKHEELTGIDGSSFEFLAIEPSMILEKFQAQLHKVVGHCVHMEFMQAIQNILQPGILEVAFPVTEQADIRNILLERAQLFLILLMGRMGTPVDFFRSELGIEIAKIPVNELMRHYGPEMQVNKANYEGIIINLFGLCELMAKIPGVPEVLKIFMGKINTPRR